MASSAGARHMAASRRPVKPVGEIPTVQDLWDRDDLENVETRFSYSKQANQRVSVWRGDITTIAADVIVNAANRSLLGGGGVDGAIHSAAGPELYNECKTLGGAETGETKITKAYRLPSRYIAHTVGPIYSAAHEQECRHLLRRCYYGSLVECARVAGRSIAFSSISTGIYGYPFLQAAHVALSEARKWIDRYGEIDRIIFVVFSQKDEERYLNLLPRYFPSPPDDDPEYAELADAAHAAETSDAVTSSTAMSSEAPADTTVEPRRDITPSEDPLALHEGVVYASPAEPREVPPERSVPSPGPALTSNTENVKVKAEDEEDKPTITPRPFTPKGHGTIKDAAPPVSSVKFDADTPKTAAAQGSVTGTAKEGEDHVEDEGPEGDVKEAEKPAAAGVLSTADGVEVGVEGIKEEDSDWVKVEKGEGAGIEAGDYLGVEKDTAWPASSQTVVADEDEGDKKKAVPFIEINIIEEERKDEHDDDEAGRDAQKKEGGNAKRFQE